MCQLQQFHLLVGTREMGIVSPVLQEVCCHRIASDFSDTLLSVSGWRA